LEKSRLFFSVVWLKVCFFFGHLGQSLSAASAGSSVFAVPGAAAGADRVSRHELSRDAAAGRQELGLFFEKLS